MFDTIEEPNRISGSECYLARCSSTSKLSRSSSNFFPGLFFLGDLKIQERQ
jgi:hypothetical protein